MKVYNSGFNTLYISNSCLREHKRILKSLRKIPQERFIDFIIDSAYGRLGIGTEERNIEKFMDFCRKFSGKKEINTAILEAHGYNCFGKWCYDDGLMPKPIQGWIDEHDGNYDLLMLQVCNPYHEKPIIQKSMAVVPTDIVSFMNTSCLEHLLVLPGEGAVPFNKKKIKKLPSNSLLKYLQPYVSY